MARKGPVKSLKGGRVHRETRWGFVPILETPAPIESVQEFAGALDGKVRLILKTDPALKRECKGKVYGEIPADQRKAVLYGQTARRIKPAHSMVDQYLGRE